MKGQELSAGVAFKTKSRVTSVWFSEAFRWYKLHQCTLSAVETCRCTASSCLSPCFHSITNHHIAQWIRFGGISDAAWLAHISYPFISSYATVISDGKRPRSTSDVSPRLMAGICKSIALHLSAHIELVWATRLGSEEWHAPPQEISTITRSQLLFEEGFWLFVCTEMMLHLYVWSVCVWVKALASEEQAVQLKVPQRD